MPELLRETQLCKDPDRMIVFGAGLYTADLAQEAVSYARLVMPKVTGYVASTLTPIYGVGWFGIYFPDRRAWFLERGTRPFTMRSLAGKTIPMWIDDPTGTTRKENPKAEVRTTVDGRTQVKIFRRVGVKPASTAARRTKIVRTNPGGLRVARYPGQAGRIARREAAAPLTTAGRTGGRIARGNVGVAWRNPGMEGRRSMNMALTSTAFDSGMQPEQIYLADDATFFSLVRT